MKEISDEQLLAELKRRFNQTKEALHDIRAITKKLEEMNRRLQASEQVKSTFVSLVKNEINNPLGAILGLSEQLNKGYVDAESVPSVAAMIHKEAFGLDFQLRNIFAAGEIEAGDTELEVSLVDIPSIISSTVDTFKHLIDAKKLKVTTPDGEKILFKTDAAKLTLIITNLIDNAIEFNREGGGITIEASVADEILTVAIADTGIGVDLTRTGRLFDAFHQMDHGLRKSYKGHGLGLSIIKALLDILEGEIKISGADQGGTVFTITIPESAATTGSDSFAVEGNEFFFDDDDQEEAF